MTPTHALRGPRSRAALTSGLVALAITAFAWPAAAAVYYVSPSGSASNSGTSPSAAWTLGKANASLVAGDVCYLLPGSYSGDVYPANSGTAGARISYIGNIADPAQATVSGDIRLGTRSYVTIKGVKGSNITTLAQSESVRAVEDSVLYCIATGGMSMIGAYRCSYEYNTVGDGIGQDRWDLEFTPVQNMYCSWRHNVCNLGRVTAQPHVVEFKRAEWCEFTDNQVTVTMPAGAADVHARIFYGIKHCTFRDNTWTIVNQTSLANYIYNQRDSCQFNTYVRDTVVEDPSSVSPAFIRFATAGSYPGNTRGNRYFDCYFRSSTTMDYQNDAHDELIQGCTFVSNQIPMSMAQTQSPWFCDSLVFRHNTFYTTGNRAMDATKNYNLRLVSNVFYAAGSTCPEVALPSSGAQADSNLYFQVSGQSSNAVGSGGCSSPSGTSGWGSPRFADSTFAAFDPHLLSNSLALGAQWKDGYVGAMGASGPDVTPPQSVSDLGASQVGDQSVVLQWTAPGDDGMTGVASVYDLRWSTSPIDGSNFSSATPVSVEPVPASGGTVQSYVVLGLAPATTYYFAIKARDDAGNWSGISNVFAPTTTATDQLPPAPVSDLGSGS